MNNQLTPQLSKLKPYLLLLVILLLAYLPVSTFHFAMKNDAFSDNFPNKFFLTESIRSGFLPLWNPYLNFGFPIYADPGFAFWNPITWFFGAAIGYNAYALTLEVLAYIYLAGVMMYHLGRGLNFDITTSVTIAAMYMCSGFFTGEIQHINFLTSAAFLPFLLQRFLILFQQPDFKSASLASIAYYLVFAGGHPAVPIATIYFLFTLTCSQFLFNQACRKNWKIILPFLLLSVLIFFVLYSPSIYSYFVIIKEYGRGLPVDQHDSGAINSGFSPSCYLSFLYPFATVKNAFFLTDDLSMRNVYFSVAGFALALTQVKSKSYLVKSLITCSIVMAGLSCGGFFKTIIYSHLPFLGYIKTNGEYRIFIILCFCLMAGIGLNGFASASSNTNDRFRRMIKTILIITLALLVYFTAKNFTDLFNSIIHPSTFFKQGLKSFIDRLRFEVVLPIALIVNLVFIIMLLLAKADVKKISFIIILDLIINSIIYLPFSGVGTVTLSEIQRTYNRSRNGISLPPLTRIKDIDTLTGKMTGLVGSLSFYNKKIGITRLPNYPSYFTRTEQYFNSSFPKVINNLPYLFLKSQINGYSSRENYSKNLTVSFFSPQKVLVKVDVDGLDSLIYLQNYFRFWYVKVDGQPTSVNRSFITFMSVPLNKGIHVVEFFYEDKWLFVFISISIISFTILLIFVSLSRRHLE